MRYSHAIKLLYITTFLFPFFGFIGLFIPYFSYTKDILCLLICFLSLLNHKANVDKRYISIFVYVILVLGSLLVGAYAETSLSIDLFRYRAEYAITMAVCFSTIDIKKSDLFSIMDDLMKITYYTGVIVAIVGLIEFVNPSLVHAFYGSKLTQHLSLLLAGGVSGRLVSTLSNPITLGLQMSISIIAGLYIANKCDSSNKKMFVIYPSLFLFCFITLYTYSRTAYIAIAGIALVYVFCIIVKSETSIGRKTIVMISTIAILGIIYHIIQSVPSLSSRFNSVNTDSFHDNIRYERAVNALGEPHKFFNDLFGFGVGKITGSSGQYVFEFGFASLLYESGFVGLGIFFVYVIKSFVIYWKNRNDAKSYGLIVSCICIITGFLLTMFTVDAYSQAPYNYYFWLSVALLLKYNMLWKESVNEVEKCK